jgi:hypothetical protein
MDGIILFADDMVFENSFENKFFHSLLSEKKYPVLAVHNLELLEKTVRSISTYKAIIIDWNFQRLDDLSDLDGIEVPDENPGDFLLKNDMFSLIYVYSDKEVDKTEIGQLLVDKYGSKIKFKQKSNTQKTPEESAILERNTILEEINKYESENQNLKVPYQWSQSINKSTQEIFRELESADPNWIRDLHKTAEADGGDPITEIINVFQHLLGESIIQNHRLQEEINTLAQSQEIPVPNKEVSLAKLYNRLFYTKLSNSAPVMTGDIFVFDNKTLGILITPECDINAKKDTTLDFLRINRSDFDSYLAKHHTYQKTGFLTSKPKHVESIIKAFNQDEIRYHCLPSFPFDTNVYNETALIDFSSALIHVNKTDFDGKRSQFKLNSPYIHQLRQRYLAYIGRVGVPSIPASLRKFNIK